MSDALTVLAVLTALPPLVFGAECLAGLGGSGVAAPSEAAPPFAVIIPAHNEAAGIAATIAAVKAQLRAVDRVIVVADNCTDHTAAIAGAAGAELVIRNCDRDRGKGFALAAGRAVLRAAPPTVAIVVDADCLPDPGALPALAATAVRDQAVIQGLYLLEDAPHPGPNAAISTFAFLIKNHVRQRGLRRFGAPGLLQGTGMAFPWSIFDAAPLASGNIVEDLELGIELAIAGVPIKFSESTCFRSAATTGAALATQRTRWEHGAIGIATRYSARLLLAAVRGRPQLILVLLDLCVPPVALLTLILFVLALAGLGIGLAGGGFGVLVTIGAEIAWMAVAILLAWWRFGRRALPATALFQMPAYIVWKLPIYLRLIGRRERRWIRTARKTTP